MKADIHPKYYPDATAICACGAAYVIGSTKETAKVEICSACHPFFTGQEKIIDTAGRVEKFRRSAAKAAAAPRKIKTKAPRVKKQAEALKKVRKIKVGKPAAEPAPSAGEAIEPKTKPKTEQAES